MEYIESKKPCMAYWDYVKEGLIDECSTLETILKEDDIATWHKSWLLDKILEDAAGYALSVGFDIDEPVIDIKVYKEKSVWMAGIEMTIQTYMDIDVFLDQFRQLCLEAEFMHEIWE